MVHVVPLKYICSSCLIYISVNLDPYAELSLLTKYPSIFVTLFSSTKILLAKFSLLHVCLHVLSFQSYLCISVYASVTISLFEIGVLTPQQAARHGKESNIDQAPQPVWIIALLVPCRPRLNLRQADFNQWIQLAVGRFDLKDSGTSARISGGQKVVSWSWQLY